MLARLLPLVLLPCVAATALPYIPTSAFINSTNATAIYVFEPNDDATSASLITLDSSRSLTSNFAATTVSSSLPFLSNTTNNPFTPFIDESGNIYVLTGDCGQGASNSALWTLKAGQDQETGTWNKADLTTSGFEDGSLTGGINYLAAGHAFASARNDTPTLYTFGGMCPNASTTSLNSANWQSSANYSKALIAASPSGILSSSSFASISSNQDTFSLTQSSARSGPVSEAGFSVTALQPSYSGTNDSIVQQNLVFIGGHTAQAFINMSQVALLSLPEQSWSFLPIDSAGSTSGELIKKDTTTVEPRSGHTAVLSEDGSKIIVFGGWVGDVSTPALPQLAVLSIGSGYGGNGQWQWSIPSTQGSAPSGNGVYGHGAVMLPGNTMMIMGGNTISGQGSKRKRATTSQAYFLNVTSNKWTADYKNPTATAISSSADSGAANSHRGRTIGLGVGLGLGIPLFFIALCLLFCCIRRRKKRDQQRQRVLDRAISSRDYIANLQSQETAYDPGQTAMVERQNTHRHVGHDWEPDSPEQPVPGAQQGGWRNMRSMEAERTGLLVEIPSPTRGLRRSLNARPTSYYDDPRNSRRSAIHVINEDEEVDSQDGDLGTAQHQNAHKQENEQPVLAADETPTRPTSSYRLPEIRSSPPILDPFADPLGMHPVSGTVSPVTSSPNEDREREDRGWIEDWEDLNTRITTQGDKQVQGQHEGTMLSSNRLSPDRVSPLSSTERKGSPNSSDRTTSTLSEKSMHSAVSFVSNISRHSGSSLARNPSQRSSHLFSTRPRTQGRAVRTSLPASGTVASAVATIQGTPPSQPRSGGRGHTRNESGDSATGSPSQKRLPSFGTLQAESHALLGRTAATPATHLTHTTHIEPEAADWIDPEEDDEFPQRPYQRRSHGIMGSVRSVLSRGRGRASSSSPTNQTATTSPTTGTFPGSSPSRSGTGTPFSLLRSVVSEQEPTGMPLQSMPDSPAQGDHRRTGSSGSNLWRKRHSGARDWDWRQGSGAMTREASDARNSHSDESKKRLSTSSPEARTITESLRDDVSGEWDVEGAIETRQVQVMFTVPRERLRVVNAADGDAQSVLSRHESTGGKGKEREQFQAAEPGVEADIGDQGQDAGDDEFLLRAEGRGKYQPGRGSPGLW